ncbi:MAG TPA: hypothetical protein VEI46_08615 [Thermodesulfovibrionales bacterium]|nr:hypothetical protein [Thermodesulfovibrionales bacterium]
MFKKKLLLGILLFVLVFAAHAPFIFLGVDICDTGAILMKETGLISEGRIRGATGMTVLSELAGGAWLELYGKPSLLWARLGGILIDSLSAVLAFSILQKYFPLRQTLLTVLISSLFILCFHRYDTLIHYYSFPAFISLIMLLSFDSGLNRDKNDVRTQSYNLSLGVLWVVIFLARFNFIVLGLLPFLVFFLWENWLVFRSRGKYHFVFTWYGGAALAMVVTYFVMMKAGVWEQYMASVMPTKHLDPFSHWTTGSLRITLMQQTVRFIKSTLILAIWTGVIIFSSRFISRISRPLRFLLVLGALVGLLFFRSKGPAHASLRFSELLFVAAVIGNVLLALKARAENPRLSRLLSLGAAVLLPLPLGSAVGLTGTTYGLWFAMPAILLGLQNLTSHKASFKFQGLSLLKPYVLPSLVVVSIIIYLMPREYYWNHKAFVPRQTILNAKFSSAGLEGIIDEPNKVKVIDETVQALNTVIKPEDVVLLYNHNALIAWLTRSRSLLDNPVLYHSFKVSIVPIVKKAMNDYGYPKAVVLNEEYEHDSHSFKEVAELKAYYTQEMHYQEILRNEAFSIYVRR